MSNRLIVAPTAGLGNRMLAVLSGHRIARRLERQFNVLWFPDDECCCELKDLVSEPVSITRDDARGLRPIDRSWYAHEHRAYGTPLEPFNPAVDILVNSNTVFVHDDEVRQRFRHSGAELAEFSDSLQQLGVLPAITDPVDEFCNDHDFEKCIGLHIRRGYRDEKFDTSWFESVGLDVYKKIAEKCLAAGYRLHVCSDDVRVVEIFQNEFDASAFPVASREKGSDVKAIQDALKDIIVMSRSKYVISLYGSTFGYLAAILGKTSLLCVKNDTVAGLRLEPAVNFGSFTRSGTAVVEEGPIKL